MFQSSTSSTTSECLECCQIILSSVVCSSCLIFFPSLSDWKQCLIGCKIRQSAFERREATRSHTQVPHLKGFVKKKEVLEKVFLFLARRNDEMAPNITCNRERFEKFQCQSSCYKLSQPTPEAWLLLAILAFYLLENGFIRNPPGALSSDGIKRSKWLRKGFLFFYYWTLIVTASNLTRTSPSTLQY